jgi:hypothetical protein
VDGFLQKYHFEEALKSEELRVSLSLQCLVYLVVLFLECLD